MRAASQDPSIDPAIGPYVSMLGLPSCLDAVEPKAKAVYRTGWRPEFTPGPSRAELAAIASRAVPVGAGLDPVRPGRLPRLHARVAVSPQTGFSWLHGPGVSRCRRAGVLALGVRVLTQSIELLKGKRSTTLRTVRIPHFSSSTCRTGWSRVATGVTRSSPISGPWSTRRGRYGARCLGSADRWDSPGTAAIGASSPSWPRMLPSRTSRRTGPTPFEETTLEPRVRARADGWSWSARRPTSASDGRCTAQSQALRRHAGQRRAHRRGPVGLGRTDAGQGHRTQPTCTGPIHAAARPHRRDGHHRGRRLHASLTRPVA